MTLPSRLLAGVAFFVGGIVFSASASSSAAAPTASPKASKSDGPSPWVFSLLPKSLDSNPRVDVTIITEMTDAGRARPSASSTAPVYYQLVPGSYVKVGDSPTSSRTLPREQLQAMLQKALASAGFLPADEQHPATLAVVYTWGLHSLLSRNSESDLDATSREAIFRNLLDRAALIGGAKFARELKELMERADAMAATNPAAREDPTGLVPGIDPALGAAQQAMMNPVALFKQASQKNAFLVEQSAEDIYYMVASAYDFAAMAKNEKQLLWRTRMTVDTQGVSETDTLPTMIATAGPYLGKDMPEVEVITRKVNRKGVVELGPLEVITDKPLAP